MITTNIHDVAGVVFNSSTSNVTETGRTFHSAELEVVTSSGERVTITLFSDKADALVLNVVGS